MMEMKLVEYLGTIDSFNEYVRNKKSIPGTISFIDKFGDQTSEFTGRFLDHSEGVIYDMGSSYFIPIDRMENSTKCQHSYEFSLGKGYCEYCGEPE